jgi:hypothetical protein
VERSHAQPGVARLGVVARLDRGGRTPARELRPLIKALTRADLISLGTTPITTMAYEAATSGYTRLVSVVSQANSLTRRAISHTDEPRRPDCDTPRLRASAAYIRKRGSDLSAGSIAEASTGSRRTLADGTRWWSSS